MEEEGKGGHSKMVWLQFLGQQRWRQQGAASAAKGDVPAKGEKPNQRVFSDTERAWKHNGEREAGQQEGDLVSDQRPPAAQRSHSMILEIFERGMRDGGGWKMQDLSHFFDTQEIQRVKKKKKKKNPLPFNISGAGVLGLFSFFFSFFFFLVRLFCFVFQVGFSEIFLKNCTFYKVYQVFSYLKPNVNRSL